MTNLQEQREYAGKIRAFILKLAGDSEGDRQGSVEAIVRQFQGLETNRYFPDVFASLDSDDVWGLDARALGEYEQGVLRQAIDSYVQSAQGHQ